MVTYIYVMKRETNGLITKLESSGLTPTSVKLITNNTEIEFASELTVDEKITLDNEMISNGFVYKEMVI